MITSYTIFYKQFSCEVETFRNNYGNLVFKTCRATFVSCKRLNWRGGEASHLGNIPNTQHIVVFSANSQNVTPNPTAFDEVGAIFLNKLLWRKMTLHVHVVCMLHLNFKYPANRSSNLSYEREIYSRNCFCLFYFCLCHDVLLGNWKWYIWQFVFNRNFLVIL